jgi:hypothetical protein
MSNIFDEFKYIQIKEDYDLSPGRLTPEGIEHRLSKFVFRHNEHRDGKIRSVEGINLTLAKIYTEDNCRIFIDLRDIHWDSSDYFETEDISNLHTYILKHNYKVYVNQEVLEKIISVCPEFFDGMDLEEAPITNKDLNMGARVTGYLSPSAKFTAGGHNIQYAATSVKVLKQQEPEAECPVCGFVDKLSVSKCKKCGAIFEDSANNGS